MYNLRETRFGKRDRSIVLHINIDISYRFSKFDDIDRKCQKSRESCTVRRTYLFNFKMLAS